MKIHFMGTSSGAGKTVMSAMFCRCLVRRGISVAPFKASNLSLNSFATPDGKEIGMGQAFQALACGVEPDSDMNPVLIKPSGTGMQLIVNGMPTGPLKRPGHNELMEIALEAFDRISLKYECVVCEGSGSPAELNMMDREIANIRLARERNIPAVLVGDIDRGGVFAGLYGTWKLIPEKDRHIIKGFIINRFRGDASILKAGTDRIEELTGMRFLGTMPLEDLKFPDEDSLNISTGRLNGTDVRDAYLKNIDALADSAETHLDIDGMIDIAGSSA